MTLAGSTNKINKRNSENKWPQFEDTCMNNASATKFLKGWAFVLTHYTILLNPDG